MSENFKKIPSIIILVMSAILLLMVVLGRLGRVYWFFDLLSHFQVYYLLAFVACAVLLLLLRAWKYAPFSIIGAILVIIAITSARGTAAQSADSIGILSVQFLNVNIGNRDYDRIYAEIERAAADVVVIGESSDALYEFIDEKGDFADSHHVSSPGSAFAITFFSKQALDSVTTKFFVEEVYHDDSFETPGIEAVMTIDGRKMRVIGVHPVPPVGENKSQSRNVQLSALAHYVAENPLPTVIVGDFNMTPYSPYFKDILEVSGLQDAREGSQSSWPAFLPAFLRIPIDHTLVSPDFAVVSRQVGKDIGSDHLPVQMEIGF